MLAFLEVAGRFVVACEAAGIACFLGGSAATALHGEPRMTNDLDFVIDANEAQVDLLAHHLGPDFEVDLDTLRSEARRRGSWNLFYLPDFTKIDVFFLRGAPYDQAEFDRRRQVQIPGGPTLWIKSPEDSVLRKLLWFQAGGHVSEKQWRDVVMVLRVNAGHLEEEYLNHWATRLGLADLLTRARTAHRT